MNWAIYIRNQTRQNISGVEAFIEEMGTLVTPTVEGGELSVLFCGDDFMRKLNLQYRNKDKTTDVLAFYTEIPNILGDIVVCIPKAKRQALGGLKNEIETLLCHGFLHLLGYDHEKSEKAYKQMMDLQAYLLKTKQTELTLL